MNYSERKLLASALALLAIASFSLTGFGQTQSNGSGDWGSPSTWVGGNPPTNAFEINVGHEVTAGPSVNATLDGNATVFGTFTVNGADLQIGRLNEGGVTSGTVNVQSGRLSISRSVPASGSASHINISGGVYEIRDSSQALIENVTRFTVSGGRFSTAASSLRAEVNLSGGLIEFTGPNGVSDTKGFETGSWTGGRVAVNTNAVGGLGGSSVTRLVNAWTSNGANELAIGSKDTKQTFSVNNGITAAQGVLVFNIYSPTDNDLLKVLNSNSISLSSGVTIRVEGVDLEGSINDYIGSTYKLFDINNGNYSNIAATLDVSSLTIGGMLHPDIWWDASNLGVDGTISMIPEPSTYALMFGGVVICLAVVRRRRKNG